MVIFECGHYTCADCLCPIQGKALIEINDDNLRQSHHPARCDLLKPGAPVKKRAKPAPAAERRSND